MAVAGSAFQNILIRDDKLSYEFSSAEEAAKFHANNGLFIESAGLESYDFIIIYGLQLVSVGSGRRWYKDICFMAENIVSSRLVNIIQEQQIKESVNYLISYQLCNYLKHNKLKTNLLAIPCPYPNEGIIDLKEKWKLPSHEKLKGSESAHQYVEKYISLIKDMYDNLDVECFFMPDIVVSEDYSFFTNRKYKVIAKGKDDVAHLNIDGAKVLLDEILKHLMQRKQTLDRE